MECPEDLKPFIPKDRWNQLALGNLAPKDQKNILEMLREAFAGEDPNAVDPDDVEDVLDEAQKLADDFRESFDEGGYDANEAQAGANASDEVLEDMESGEDGGE